MHEAGAVTRAIAARFDVRDAGPVPQHVHLVVRDPLRADPDFVQLFATELLRDRGVTDPLVTVETMDIPCPECGRPGRPTPGDPACDGCGTPFRPLDGPPIVVAAG